MQIDHHGTIYRMTRASDLQRDGMSLELQHGDETVAEVFYSDITRQFSISIFAPAVPLEVIEPLIAISKKTLPPAP